MGFSVQRNLAPGRHELRRPRTWQLKGKTEVKVVAVSKADENGRQMGDNGIMFQGWYFT